MKKVKKNKMEKDYHHLRWQLEHTTAAKQHSQEMWFVNAALRFIDGSGDYHLSRHMNGRIAQHADDANALERRSMLLHVNAIEEYEARFRNMAKHTATWYGLAFGILLAAQQCGAKLDWVLSMHSDEAQEARQNRRREMGLIPPNRDYSSTSVE